MSKVGDLAGVVMYKSDRNRELTASEQSPTIKSAASAWKLSELSVPSSAVIDFIA